MRHYGPLSVAIYADGYTLALGIACEAEATSSEDHGGLYQDVITIRPLEVTCKGCRATQLFKENEAAYLASGIVKCPVEPNLVPHMRTAVVRNGGRFDTEATIALRRLLGLPEGLPSPDLVAKVHAIEAAKQVGHAERRVERLRADLEIAEAELAEMKRAKLGGTGPQD